MVSLMRDKEPDGLPLDHPYAEHEWLKLHEVYDRCYQIDGDKSYELQLRNQRQSLRPRTRPECSGQGLITAAALAGPTIEDHEILDWAWAAGRPRAVQFRLRTALRRENTELEDRHPYRQAGVKMAQLVEKHDRPPPASARAAATAPAATRPPAMAHQRTEGTGHHHATRRLPALRNGHPGHPAGHRGRRPPGPRRLHHPAPGDDRTRQPCLTTARRTGHYGGHSCAATSPA